MMQQKSLLAVVLTGLLLGLSAQAGDELSKAFVTPPAEIPSHRQGPRASGWGKEDGFKSLTVFP